MILVMWCLARGFTLRWRTPQIGRCFIFNMEKQSAKEYQIYAQRLQERNDELLEYGKQIADEVDICQRRLADAKAQAEKELKELSQSIEKKTQEFADLKERMAGYEAELGLRQTNLDNLQSQVKKRKEELLIEYEDLLFEREDLAKLIAKAKTEKEQAQQIKERIIQSEYLIASALKSAVAKEKAAQDKNNDADKRLEQIADKTSKLAQERKDLELAKDNVAKTRKELEAMRAEIDAQGKKLQSQQEAFRLAVNEAKAKWQMQK